MDGDTIDFQISLGFDIYQNLRFRLYGINTPEIKGPSRPQGLKAKAFVESALPIGQEVTINTYKDRKEKYGRYLAEVLYIDSDGKLQNLNKVLVAQGLAVPFMENS